MTETGTVILEDIDPEIVDIEHDDGYPTDEWLKRLRMHRFTPGSAARFVVNVLPKVPEFCCASADVIDGKTAWTHRPCKMVSFSTGGWSGAESIIDIALNHFFIEFHHKSWQRGGHYEFEVPLDFLEAK